MTPNNWGSIESRRTVSQMEQTERETRNVEEVRHAPERVMTGSSTQEQPNQVGARLNDCETNTAVVEIRLTRDEDIIHTHDQEIQVPSSNGGLSSSSMHMEETILRTNILQLDGPTSARVQRRQPLPITRRTTIPGDGYPDDSDSNSCNN